MDGLVLRCAGIAALQPPPAHTVSVEDLVVPLHKAAIAETAKASDAEHAAVILTYPAWWQAQDGVLIPRHKVTATDEGRWITTDFGNHVFIREGETLQDAFKRMHNQQEAQAWGDAAYKAWRDGLTNDQHDEITLYQSTGYHGLNEALRTGNKTMLRERAQRIKTLDAALDKAKTDKDLTVYRLVSDEPPDEHTGISQEGVTPLMRLREGDTFVDPGYVSTSLTSDYAEDYDVVAGSKMRYAVVAIHVPKATHAAYIGTGFLELGGVEQELLIGRGAHFKLLSRSTKGNVVHMALDLVPDAAA